MAPLPPLPQKLTTSSPPLHRRHYQISDTFISTRDRRTQTPRQTGRRGIISSVWLSTMNFHQQHQTSADNNRGFPADQILGEENRQKGEPSLTAEGSRGRTSSSSSSSSSASPRQDFSVTDNGRTDGDLLLLSGKAVEMTPADEIFFHGHLLPLHLLSHFYNSYSSPQSSTDCLDCFSLPIGNEYLQDDDPSTISNKSSISSGTANTNFKSRSGNKIHSETTPQLIPSDMRGRNSKTKPFWLFGLSRQRRACNFQGDEGKEKEKKRKFRFDLNRTFRRYLGMARPLLFFRWRRREEDIELQAQTFASRGTKIFSAPASIRTSPRNSGLLVKTPALSAAISDSTVEELQAAIQAAIAYCKKSIADEEEENKNSKHDR